MVFFALETWCGVSRVKLHYKQKVYTVLSLGNSHNIKHMWALPVQLGARSGFGLQIPGQRGPCLSLPCGSALVPFTVQHLHQWGGCQPGIGAWSTDTEGLLGPGIAASPCSIETSSHECSTTLVWFSLIAAEPGDGKRHTCTHKGRQVVEWQLVAGRQEGWTASFKQQNLFLLSGSFHGITASADYHQHG